jgi:hypothetical protein
VGAGWPSSLYKLAYNYNIFLSNRDIYTNLVYIDYIHDYIPDYIHG